MNLDAIMKEAIVAAGAWIGFDDYMQMALYHPEWGYYTGGLPKLGLSPRDGSDFVTAPELSPLFARSLAVQLSQALDRSQTHEIWEFGAGSGLLAKGLLEALGSKVGTYHIVDISGQLRAQQAETLARFANQVSWESALPEQINGVVIGNEVLDAMPCKLIVRQGGVWFERGVGLDAAGQFCYADRPTTLHPPIAIWQEEGAQQLERDYLTEIHPQAEAFVRSIAERLQSGALFFIDYGFPEREYYHPQRSMGSLMCHQAHRADDNPLVQAGQKDITTHLNFTGLALAAQEAGLEILGYTSQAHFLLNCGIAELMQHSDLPERVHAHKLLAEHEMGELFKVIAWVKPGQYYDAIGFKHGDRSHTL